MRCHRQLWGRQLVLFNIYSTSLLIITITITSSSPSHHHHHHHHIIITITSSSSSPSPSHHHHHHIIIIIITITSSSSSSSTVSSFTTTNTRCWKTPRTGSVEIAELMHLLHSLAAQSPPVAMGHPWVWPDLTTMTCHRKFFWQSLGSMVEYRTTISKFNHPTRESWINIWWGYIYIYI